VLQVPLRDPIVSADGVVLRYGTTVAIAESGFAIPRGAVTALIGPNGSGKSTLLSAIAGLIEPAAGSISHHVVNGREARISYVLQMTKVNEALPISVREVVAMGRYASAGAHGRLRRADREAVSEAMARIGIADLGDHRLTELSGGQRQRVFVAQGLAQDHDLLLLDEPLTGLDLPSARAIDEVIHAEQLRGSTVVVSTHDLFEARVADHVLLLSGRVVAAGPPAEVLTMDHLTAAYGPSLLHVDGEQLFLDDPAHRPVAGRHLHRDRTIHVEAPGSDAHEPG
jgi:iron complex transport system ATP-binding protein